MDIIQYIIDHSTEFVSNGGIFVGFLLVFIECFIPALPLSVFVALNVNAFGFLFGFLISWSATCLGSYICYRFFTFIEGKMTQKFLNRKTVQRVKKAIDKFQKIKFINILSGLTRVPREKFISALLIGKSFSVVFWGYIGKSLIESLTDIYSIIYIIGTLILAYIISKIVSHRMHIE